MADKSLAKEAFIGWYIGLVPDATAALAEKAWRCTSQNPNELRAWQAAAEAVRDEVVSQAAIDEQMFYSPMSPIRNEGRAVIDAARAWAQTAGNSMHGTTADLDLYEAIEALEAADDTDASP